MATDDDSLTKSDWPVYLSDMTIEEIYKRSFRNRDLIKTASECHCVYCLRAFPPDMITEWLDPKEAEGEGQTAVCPFCGLDSLIPKNRDLHLTSDLMGQMHEKYFH